MTFLVPFLISPWADFATVKGVGDFLILIYVALSLAATLVIAFDASRRELDAPQWAIFCLLFCVLALPLYLRRTRRKEEPLSRVMRL